MPFIASMVLFVCGWNCRSFHGYDIRKFNYRVWGWVLQGKRPWHQLNPILNSFQQTVKQYIDDLVQAFLKSMKLDLIKSDYNSKEEYDDHLRISWCVGLMCLKVFVAGDDKRYAQLKDEGCDWDQSANFFTRLERWQLGFERKPWVDLNSSDENAKKAIINEKKILE
jgi:hypothetical protein